MSSLPLRLGSILDQEKYPDCSFQFPNGSKVSGHKIILSAASPVFEAMFYGSFAKKRDENTINHSDDSSAVPIIDISTKTFRTMLQFIYTDSADWKSLTIYDLLELHYCAEKYLLHDLVTATVANIQTALNCNNVFLIYDFSLRFQIPGLLSECRCMVRELLERKPNLFFKKMFQVNCDRVIRDCTESDEEENRSPNQSPCVKRKPPVPIEFIDEIQFTSSSTSSKEPFDNYYHVRKECVNDLLLLNYDDNNGTFNESLLLFVLKWTNIEWRLQSAGKQTGEQKLALQKLPLINFYEPFVCHKITLPLVENLIGFLDNNCYLNVAHRIPTLGWHLLQRVPLKANRPLTLSLDDPSQTNKGGGFGGFVTRLQVNHRIAIKSFIINSRLNNAVQSRLLRLNRQSFHYKENVTLEICSDGQDQDQIVHHRQQFHLEAEFNSQFELFLNKWLMLEPERSYSLRLSWPRDQGMVREYPRQIFERCQSLVINGTHFSCAIHDDVEGETGGEREEQGRGNDGEVNLTGGIVQGMRFMFVS